MEADRPRSSISAQDLHARLGTAAAPILIDVRRAASFDADETMIAGSIRLAPEDVTCWAGELSPSRPVVLCCVHGHDGERCSFDAFLRRFGLEGTDPALDRLALVVRGADTGRLELTPQSPGLLAIAQGLSATHSDDYAMLASGIVLYDALYAWCRHPSGAAPQA